MNVYIVALRYGNLKSTVSLGGLASLGATTEAIRGSPAVEKRLRDNVIVIEDGNERHVPTDEFMRVRILEPEDIVVLYTVALQIEEGGFLRPGDPDRGLSTLSNVPVSIVRLQRNGLIEAERNGNTWVVRWGERAVKIARASGVSIAE